MTPDPPPHPLPALTTSELACYRRDLEHSLTAATAPNRTQLQARLADVLAEQNHESACAGPADADTGTTRDPGAWAA